MALVRVKPTLPDVAIARAVAAHTGRPTEYVAQGLTWGADEHVLMCHSLRLVAVRPIRRRADSPCKRPRPSHDPGRVRVAAWA